MQSHAIVWQCCFAITNLSANNVNNIVNLGNANMCQLLADTLKMYSSSEDIIEEALAAVASMTTNKGKTTNHEKFLTTGICGYFLI